jgi:Ribonucleases G and E
MFRKDAYQETKKYMSQVLPSCSKFVKQYKNKEPIFSKYKVDKEIVKMFEPEVKLKSGGYIVINPTEALVAIDVNSGGATKERNIEKTALKTNLEAAEEIAKQIKIRDLSGLIVIDFIDMYEMRNNRSVEKKIRELIKKDRARTQISRISQFGLLEMSRQRLRQGFIEWRSELSLNSIALKIIYQIKEVVSSKKYKSISVNVSPYNKNFLSANYNDEINNISKVSGVNINIFENIELHETQINIEEYKKNSTRAKKSKPVKKIKKAVKKRSINKKENVKPEKKQIKEDINTIKEIKNKKTGWWTK